jgi:hypothetical protein
MPESVQIAGCAFCVGFLSALLLNIRGKMSRRVVAFAGLAIVVDLVALSWLLR